MRTILRSAPCCIKNSVACENAKKKTSQDCCTNKKLESDSNAVKEARDLSGRIDDQRVAIEARQDDGVLRAQVVAGKLVGLPLQALARLRQVLDKRQLQSPPNRPPPPTTSSPQDQHRNKY